MIKSKVLQFESSLQQRSDFDGSKIVLNNDHAICAFVLFFCHGNLILEIDK